MRILVWSDVHANGPASAAAAALVDERSPDVLLVLGDLVTYGADPQQVLDIHHELAERVETRFAFGNHEEIYEDEKPPDYAAPWVRETIEWTAERVDRESLVDGFEWESEIVIGDLLFAHANPFGPRDWTYLNTTEQVARAANVLAEREIRGGFFGHTHRARTASGPEWIPEVPSPPERWTVHAPRIVNVGSVGQPRDSRHRMPSTVVEVDLRGDTPVVTLLPLAYDRDEHVRRVLATAMRDETKQRLAGFFAQSSEST